MSALVALTSGCTASLELSGPNGDQPHCVRTDRGHFSSLDGSLVISAQSVPSAALVPCLHRLPAGWTFRDFRANKGRTQFWLNLGAENENAVTMTFTQTCDIGTTRRTLTDEPGTLRFEDLRVDASGENGTRYYTFDGGCVAYEFDVRGAAAPEAIRTISRAIGFIDRDALRRYVDAYSNGRFHLDPSHGG
ncbi:MAG TPA: hypothetical protein VGH43_07975 [Jatrophihabitans sp.]